MAKLKASHNTVTGKAIPSIGHHSFYAKLKASHSTVFILLKGGCKPPNMDCESATLAAGDNFIATGR